MMLHTCISPNKRVCWKEIVRVNVDSTTKEFKWRVNLEDKKLYKDLVSLLCIEIDEITSAFMCPGFHHIIQIALYPCLDLHILCHTTTTSTATTIMPYYTKWGWPHESIAAINTMLYNFKNILVPLPFPFLLWHELFKLGWLTYELFLLKLFCIFVFSYCWPHLVG